MVRRAVCLPLALARFSVINVDFDVLLPPPLPFISRHGVFVTAKKKSKKKNTPISGERYSRVLSGRNLALALHAAQGGGGRRDMPIIMQHIPCPANSRLQTKRALSSCLLSKWGRAALESTASRVQRPPVKRKEAELGTALPHPRSALKLPQRRRLCFAAAVTIFFFSHCFTGVGGVLLSEVLGRHLHHRYYYYYYYPVHTHILRGLLEAFYEMAP